MKKIIMLLIFGLLATRVSALQFYEAFSYPTGSLNNQGGWVLSAGSQPTVVSGSLATPGLMPPSEFNSLTFGGGVMEVRHALTNLLGGEQPGTYFYSLAFKVTGLGTLSTNGGFIAAFSQSIQTNSYGGMLFLRKDLLGTLNGYNIGVAKTSGTGGDVTWAPDVFLVGQTNFVVCKYATPDQGDTTTLLWINPDPSTYGLAGPTPTLTATAGTDLLTGVGQILLHQTSATEGPGGIIVDQIRVQGTWPNVTPVPLTIAFSRNGTNLDLSWGGFQDVYLQQATNLSSTAVWQNLNSDASIHSFSAPINSTNKFFRLHAWYAP